MSRKQTCLILLPNLCTPSCVFQQFYAVYAFQARCDQELTLQEYQHVRILQFSDLGGNKNWWLAESNGQKGYVPANYLGRMSYAWVDALQLYIRISRKPSQGEHCNLCGMSNNAFHLTLYSRSPDSNSLLCESQNWCNWSNLMLSDVSNVESGLPSDHKRHSRKPQCTVLSTFCTRVVPQNLRWQWSDLPMKLILYVNWTTDEVNVNMWND